MLRRLFHRDRPAHGRSTLGRDFRPGDLLEQRFEIEQVRLGFMGIVYIAYDRQRRGRVVLKTFQNKFLWDDEAIARFNNEAELWMRLGGHPNIVRAYDLRSFLGKPHVVAEYVHGGPLRALVGHLSVQEALDYAIQICWGMIHATERAGVMHCDLKPDNIMVTLDGQAKVTDFGLARVLPIWQWSDELRAQSLPPRLRTTVVEVLGGTLPYMGPELLERASSAGTWSDIYAFGVMLYELLTGRLPFDSMRDESVIRMHRYQPPPDLRKLKPDLPEDVVQLIHLCMAKRPSDRPQSFGEVERLLQKLRAAMFGAPYEPRTPDGDSTGGEQLVERGLMHMDLREYSEALTCFRRAADLNDSQPGPWLHMASARLRLWQYNEALSAVDEGLRRAVSRNDFGQLYQARGEVLAAMLRPSEAAAAYDQGLSYTPNAPGLWREKGALFLRQGLPREARELLEKALSFDRLDPQIWRLLGDAALADQRPRPAYRAYAEALKLDPRSALGWARYGAAQLKIGKAKEAQRSFEAALRLDPELQEALDGLRQARRG